MHALFEKNKLLLTLFGALAAALAVTLGVLQIRVWLQPRAASMPAGQTISDRQKLDILASLSATSTPSAAQKSKALHSLSTDTTNGQTEAEKLHILQSLQATP